MKKYLLLFILFLFLGCAEDNHKSSKVYVPSGEINKQRNQLLLGTNEIIYNHGAAQLYTAFYHTNYNTANSEANFSATNATFYPKNKTEKQYLKITGNPYLRKLTPREEIEKRLVDFRKYVKDNNIKSINQQNKVYKKTVPAAIQEGTQWNNISVLDDQGVRKINAKCIAVSNHAYFFLEDGQQELTQEQISSITSSFDKDYSTVHKYFGQESDVDQNGKIIFLIADLKNNGLMGFFYEVDKYLNQDIDYYQSNEADILYINRYFFNKNMWDLHQANILATFIHEFQHMVYYDTRTAKNLSTDGGRWLNEGLSMVSEYYGGYGKAHKSYLKGYFNNSQGELPLVTENMDLDYGYSYLFVRYLVERFGDQVIKKIYDSPSTSVQAVEDATKMKFDLLFEDFVKMILYTGRNVTTDKKYNIPAFNHTAGSEEYNKNGFNLSNIIDEAISLNQHGELMTEKGIDVYLVNYSLLITKWTAKDIKFIEFSCDDNNVKGIYQTW